LVALTYHTLLPKSRCSLTLAVSDVRDEYEAAMRLFPVR
jgi:hypothetical protein